MQALYVEYPNNYTLIVEELISNSTLKWLKSSGREEGRNLTPRTYSLGGGGMFSCG
jgi:hypothetical protein